MKKLNKKIGNKIDTLLDDIHVNWIKIQFVPNNYLWKADLSNKLFSQLSHSYPILRIITSYNHSVFNKVGSFMGPLSDRNIMKRLSITENLNRYWFRRSFTFTLINKKLNEMKNKERIWINTAVKHYSTPLYNIHISSFSSMSNYQKFNIEFKPNSTKTILQKMIKNFENKERK